MHTGRNKFRKRQRQTPQDKSQRTAILRQIGEDFQKRKFALGLAKANAALAASSATGPEQAQVLSLVADSEFKRGRFREAAHIHLQAGSRSVSHPTLWLRAHIGQVRALLKVPQVDQAVIMARHAVAVAEAKMSQFNDKVSAANKEFHKKGTVLVPWVPPRVSVVATRMGYLFLQEGEPEAAEELFEKAIQSCKGGANRARQGLAQIALAKGEYGKARNISVDAIRRGGFKAKTLSSWITLIAAGRQLPERRISDRLINGLCVAPAGLRARTILTIVRELRKSDMYQWREITEQWSSREGAHFPIIEVEIRKLILASEKRKLGNTTERKTAAERLLKSPGLSPNEWLSAAKELVQSSLREGEQINISQLLSKAGDLYGKEYSFMAAHSLALSCMMAKRHDLARSILQANIQRVARDQKIWGKSIWALARMESLLGDHGAAAVLFRQFFEEASTPVRFRLQAQLLWCQELIASGHMDALLEVRSLMTRTLGNVEDPEILMNYARQMAVTLPELEGWSQEIFEQGSALALDQYKQATHPSVAISILFKLTRRQVYDFGYLSQAVRFWEEMPEDKVTWLWSEKANFWEYMGLLMDAYIRLGEGERAEAFMREWSEDPATPPEGKVQLGIPFGVWLVGQARGTDALSLFNVLTAESPCHPLCGLAWYWKALAAHKRGDSVERDRCVDSLRNAQGLAPIMQSKWHLDAKALLLRAELNMENIDSQEQVYPPEQMKFLKDEMIQEMAALP